MPLDTSPTLKPLRPHQQRAIDLLRASLGSGHRRPMVQAPTGAGKTVIAASIVHGARSKLKRVCFTVPAISLIDQTLERFAENGIDPADMGVIQANHPWTRPHCPIQIASVDTLNRRSQPETDLVIVDEAHRKSEAITRWMASCPRLPFIGLSATPWSKGLGLLYDDLIRPTSMRELIDEGHLSPFKVYAPSHPDLTGVRTTAGDYNEADLADRMNKAELVADIVQTWIVRGNNEPTLCFAVDRAHAKALHDRFEAAGVAVAYVDANTPIEERDQIGKQLAAGAIKVVCNIGCLTTGIDWDVRCIILARPTKSEILYMQIIGRGLRTATGKAFCTILDHSDTTLRLGMVTDIDHDTLDMGTVVKAKAKRAEKVLPLPKECPSCAGLIPVNASECPCCGAAKPRAWFHEQEGDLVELDISGNPVRSKSKLPPVIEMLQQQGKQSIYSQLLQMGDDRKWSRGRVGNTYKDIFGVYPRNVDDTERTRPTLLLSSWVKSRNIAWAKRQAKADASEVTHA